jgi:hypothetical protein
MTAPQQLDMLWAPTRGERVLYKPGHGAGLATDAEVHEVVSEPAVIDGEMVMFVRPTGPITTRTTRRGRVIHQCPSHQNTALAADLMPAA